MDALSDVLRAVRLTGAVFFDVQAAGPWVAESPDGRTIVRSVFASAEHLISYHVVTSGRCWAGAVGDEPLALDAGDVVVFPHGDAHVLSSEPGMRGELDLARYRRPTGGARLPFSISVGDAGGDATHLVCGFLGCDAGPFNPLLTALPRVIRVSDQTSGALRALVDFALAESREPRIGGEAMLGHLSEVMFVDVVRRYLETLPASSRNWLTALREPLVGRALMALHDAPARSWTIEALAHHAGASRSVLAERFTDLIGQPPMQYLTSWRMQLAASRLLGGVESVAAIAEQVGYESEAAFSRAFKKAVGVPPSQWRRQRSADTPAAAAGGAASLHLV